MGQNKTSSEPEDHKIKQAYAEWKGGASLRTLQAKYGLSKSKLSRVFQEIKKAEEEEAKTKAPVAPTDEQLETLRREVEASKYEEELAKAKYQARLERDRHRHEASRTREMLEECETLSDSDKLTAYVEKVLAHHPDQLSELKKRLEGFGLTFEEGLREELGINAEDYKSSKELYLKYTRLPYPSLADHIIGRVDSWLKEQRLDERKAKLKPWLDSHPPTCPECGRHYLEGKDSGDVACSWLGCKWTGRVRCPVCGTLMQYGPTHWTLECANDDCRQKWRLYSSLDYAENTT